MTGGTAEEIALRLGQSHVQLGLNLPAKSLPNAKAIGGIPEDVVLYFGIIDILQVWTAVVLGKVCQTGPPRDSGGADDTLMLLRGIPQVL